jgi:DNA-binding transcriptional LysR family regulator
VLGVDLNLLTALDALLSEQNVTRAAERLSIGQSAMSAALKRLRKHFDDPLLVREGRTMVPTPLAQTLTEPVREAMLSVEMVLGRPKGFDPSIHRRSFTIMASDYVTLILLRPLLARLSNDAPLQQVNVVPVSQDFGDQLRAGRLDMIVIPTELVDPKLGLQQRHLFDDRYVLIADNSNEAVSQSMSTEEFSSLPYVAYSGGPLPSIAEGQMDALGVVRRIEMSTQSFVVTPFLIAGTPFVSLVHERLARHVAGPAQLKIVDAPIPLRPISEALFWNPRNQDDLAHSWLRRRIMEQATELATMNGINAGH